MGADGGSIAKRDDLIKTKKQTTATIDPQQLQRLNWFQCALSCSPLKEPIVADRLGRLYNKEALIDYLLNPDETRSTEAKMIVGHVRSLKDVTTLKLTRNPAYSTRFETDNALLMKDESNPIAPFICPISLREMNGSIKFKFNYDNGYVVSESSWIELTKSSKTTTTTTTTTSDKEQDEMRLNDKQHWLTLNPKGHEFEAMKSAWTTRLVQDEQAKLLKKANKKRKTEMNESISIEKKIKPSPANLPSIKSASSVPLLSATLAAKIAAEKKNHSKAIASLYVDPNADPNKDKEGRSTWMTRSAFTRYA